MFQAGFCQITALMAYCHCIAMDCCGVAVPTTLVLPELLRVCFGAFLGIFGTGLSCLCYAALVTGTVINAPVSEVDMLKFFAGVFLVLIVLAIGAVIAMLYAA